MLSTIYQKVEVVFHISSSLVKIRLHTKNQMSGLPGTASNVPVLVRVVVVVVAVVFFFTNDNTTLFWSDWSACAALGLQA